MVTPAQRTVYQYLSARPDLTNTEVYAHPSALCDIGLTRAEFFAVLDQLQRLGVIQWRWLGGVRYTFNLQENEHVNTSV